MSRRLTLAAGPKPARLESARGRVGGHFRPSAVAQSQSRDNLAAIEGRLIDRPTARSLGHLIPAAGNKWPPRRPEMTDLLAGPPCLQLNGFSETTHFSTIESRHLLHWPSSGVPNSFPSKFAVFLGRRLRPLIRRSRSFRLARSNSRAARQRRRRRRGCSLWIRRRRRRGRGQF